ncbi:EAL domain-containing protein [Vibrio metschnikovii]
MLYGKTHHSLTRWFLAINISAKQFHQTGFVQQVLEALQRYRANPHRLKLELTESMLHEDLEDTITKMSQLKKYGVSFSLDDFGTGYSSLNYLKRLPLDQLKIDKSFVRDLLTNSHDADIARTIVSLAKSMNLAVIAEGVETQEQRLALASYGCLDFQGYLFSRPVPLEAFPFNYPDGIPTTAKTN